MPRHLGTPAARELIKQTKYIIEEYGGSVTIVEPKSHGGHLRMKIEVLGQVRFKALVGTPKNLNRSIWCTIRDFKNIIKEIKGGKLPEEASYHRGQAINDPKHGRNYGVGRARG